MKRNCRIDLRLTKAEQVQLNKKAKKAGLTVSAFIRHAIAETEVKEAPPADVPALLMEMKRIGYNLNQMTRRINGHGFGDAQQLKRLEEDLQKAEHAVLSTYTGESEWQ